MLLAGLYFLMVCKIPSPPRNLVVPSHFLQKTGKFGLIRQKHPQNKVCRARRDTKYLVHSRRVTRKTRVEHNKHNSRAQNVNGFHIWEHSLRYTNSISAGGRLGVSYVDPVLQVCTQCCTTSAPFWNADAKPRARHSIGMLKNRIGQKYRCIPTGGVVSCP